MPAKPKSPAPKMMENMTQKPLMPTLLPRIFGPRMLPSNCWSRMMNTRKMSAFSGDSIRMMSVPGIMPNSGPKNGITFVTPTMTLTSSA